MLRKSNHLKCMFCNIKSVDSCSLLRMQTKNVYTGVCYFPPDLDFVLQMSSFYSTDVLCLYHSCVCCVLQMWYE